MKTIHFDTLSYLPLILLGLAALAAAAPAAATRGILALAGIASAVYGVRPLFAVADAGSFGAQAAGGYVGARVTDRAFGFRLELDPLTAPACAAVAIGAAACLLGLALVDVDGRGRGRGPAAAAITAVSALSVVVLAADYVVVAGAYSVTAVVAALLPVTVVGARPAGEAAIRAFATHRIGDAALVLALAAVGASLGAPSPEAVLVGPLDVEPWSRLADAGLFGGQAHRTVWFFAGVGLAVAVASRLGVLCFPLLRDLTASPDLPAPLVALTHLALCGSGLVVLLKLAPVLAIAPEAQDGLMWAAALTAVLAGALGLAGRDVLRVDAHILAASCAPVIVLSCLGQAAAATLGLIVVVCLSVVLPWTLTEIARATRTRDPTDLSGLEHVYPRLHTSRLLATATVAALPPFSGWVVLERALEASLLSPKVPAALVATLGVGALAAGAASWRVLHLVFSGPRAPDDERRGRPPAGWVPILVLGLLAPALALLDLPPLLLRELPVEVDYAGPLGTFVAPAVADLRPVVSLFLPAQAPPALAPATFIGLVLVLGILPWAVSLALWRRPGGGGRPPAERLLQASATRAIADRAARLAGRESPVARGVGDAVDQLARLVASNLVPIALSLALQRLPGLVSGGVALALRRLQAGSAQAGLVLLTLWVWWLYALSK